MFKHLVILLAIGLTGCGTVISTTHGAATEERTAGEILDDTGIVARIKKAYLEESRENLLLTVFCHQGLVVLAGAVEDPKSLSQNLQRLVARRITTGFGPRRCAAPPSFLSATPQAGARRVAWMGPVFTRQYSGGLAAATPPAAKPAGESR